MGASDNAIWMAISLDYSLGVQYSLLKEIKRQSFQKEKKKEWIQMTEDLKGDVIYGISKYSLQPYF